MIGAPLLYIPAPTVTMTPSPAVPSTGTAGLRRAPDQEANAVPDTIADLTTASDLELDHALQILFNQHSKGDKQTRAELHMAITAILGEQGRRLDGWLDHTLGLS